MGAIKSHTWKELIKHAEIVEKSTKKFEYPLLSRTNRESTTRDVIHSVFPSQMEKTMAVELSGEAPPKPKRSNFNNNPESLRGSTP